MCMSYVVVKALVMCDNEKKNSVLEELKEYEHFGWQYRAIMIALAIVVLVMFVICCYG